MVAACVLVHLPSRHNDCGEYFFSMGATQASKGPPPVPLLFSRRYWLLGEFNAEIFTFMSIDNPFIFGIFTSEMTIARSGLVFILFWEKRLVLPKTCIPAMTVVVISNLVDFMPTEYCTQSQCCIRSRPGK